MKIMKRLTALLISVIMTAAFITAMPSASAVSVSQSAAQQVLGALNIMVGDENGNLNLDGYLTRAQLAKIAVVLNSGNSVVSVSKTSPFPDVPYTNWAASYIAKTGTLGYMNGYPDGTFKPNANATTEEVAKTLLSVLGYGNSDYGTGYPAVQVNFAEKLGLFDSVTSQVGSSITRRDVMYMVYNMLCAAAKSGKPYINSLGYSLSSSGSGIDVNGLISANSVGPITVKSSTWYVGTGLKTGNMTVYLNDKPSSLSNIATDNIIYYSASLNTVWAYNKTATGVLQNILPSRTSPTSIVVSGTTYTISGASASQALSYSGGFSIGDTVTVLLGRDGGAADIVSASDSGAVIGYVTASGNKAYTDSNGGAYYSYYMTLALADGSKAEYQMASDESSLVGSMASINFSSGLPAIGSVGYTVPTGTVSYSRMMIGSVIMSSNIKILDVDDYGNYTVVYPQRLDGVNLTSSNAIYSASDAYGNITELFLKDVTGDTLTYGVVTNVAQVQEGLSLKGTYSYNISGNIGTYNTTNILFSVSAGPASFTYKSNAIAKIMSLYSIPNVTLSGNNAVISNSGVKYLLSDHAVIYKYSSGNYAVISTSQTSGLNLTAYYDKPQNEGGRVRVIIAA